MFLISSGLDYILILSKSDLCLIWTACFLGLCWDIVHMSVSLPPDKLADIQQLALILAAEPTCDSPCQVMSFLGKANFCTNGQSQQQWFCHVIQSDMLHVNHSPTHLLLLQVHFPHSSFHQLEWFISIATEPSSFAISSSSHSYCY